MTLTSDMEMLYWVQSDSSFVIARLEENGHVQSYMPQEEFEEECKKRKEEKRDRDDDKDLIRD